jgi:beta-ribofuranosylaminobenzene 5'-phosphate synthase
MMIGSTHRCMSATLHSAIPLHPEQHHRVVVHAPGRLHLGFLDPAGSLGRRFGSLGLVVEGFETVVEIGPADTDTLSAGSPAAAQELERARAHLVALRQHSGRLQPLHLHLRQVLPAHAGLGSGTQLALAVGRAFASWQRLDVTTPTLASWLGRGLRSGVGIAGFDQGGLLLDGGPGAAGQPAPLLSRLALPEAWRVVVALDPRQRGLSGAAEKQALALLQPLPQASAALLCHQVLMQVLPGAADGHFETFARGLGHVQQLLGRHFAPAQQGSAYTSAAVGRLMDWCAAQGAAATGQSSWGPTGFAFVRSATQARALLAAAQAAGVLDPALQLHVARGRNHGARIETLAASQRAA